ncbi:MAG: hypothetical protein COB98_06960 [Flavobacteriaceae bacterium]|nr:MAG: hypothetical protein COB98_06960 [Flavobacteriaceae bacterium]
MKIKNKFIKAVVFSLMFFTSFLYSQVIVVDPSGEAPSTDSLEELIESVLISGGCATVNNFKSDGKKGDFKSYGFFKNSNPGFPFKEGIILSTGDASTAVGPNNVGTLSGGELGDGWLGDDDIKIILDSRFGDQKDTQNATYVQFDFIPKNKRVSFNYIFASEEWESGGYECPSSDITVQDGFAFLIVGPGITPDAEFKGKAREWRNIALIPETAIPVSIGTVYNNLACTPVSAYPEYYKTNSPVGSAVANASAVQFNAQTTVLKVEMTVIPGEVYTLKLVIADRDDTQFDSAVFLEAGSFNLGIDVGDDMTISSGNALCSGSEQTLKSNQELSLGAFQWKKWNGTVFVDISGETGVNYNVTSGGIYKLSIEISSGCVMEGEVIVEFAEKPKIPVAVADFSVCDLDKDGKFLFNLSTKDTEILNGQAATDFQVRYFPTESDLDADTNVLSSTAYTNTSVTETIWARIENKQAVYCYSKISFNLTVFEGAFPKAATEISPIVSCDNTSIGTLFDGLIIFDLTQRTSAILNGQNTGFNLEFYTDPLFTILSRIVAPANFENTIAGGQTIYVKMINDLSAECFANTSFVITVEEVPVVPVLSVIDQCDDDGTNDGLYRFDFPSLKNVEVLNGQSKDVFDVLYFMSESDAISMQNKITGEYVNTQASEIIWVRKHNKDREDCYNISSFKLNVYKSANPKTPSEIEILVFCDNLSYGTIVDGKIVFDLTQRSSEILNGQDTGFSLRFFTDISLDISKEIPDPSNYVNQTAGGETIYVQMYNDLFSGCTASTSFEIKVEKSPVLSSVTTIHQCDDDNDGTYVFDFSSLKDAEVLNGQATVTFNVKYYKTEAAANAGTNPIEGGYTNTSAVETIWYRIDNKDKTNCSVVASFGLNVYPTAKPKSSEDIEDLVYCDNTTFGTDTDGKIVFDLTEKAASILNGQDTGFTLSYYTDSAMTSTSEITNPTAYVNTTAGKETIYVTMKGAYITCEGETSFDIVVDPLPVLIDHVTLKQCDDDSDGISDFNLHEANSKISANYQNEVFTYYKVRSEAKQAVNAIVSASMYTSGISTVWARVATKKGCFRLAQVDLIVSTTLIPSSFLQEFKICDDELDGDNTNGISVFDFSGVEAIILAGGFFPAGQQPIISYYKNAADALAEENSIVDTSNYRNTGYPNEQFIYVRVDSELNNDCIGFGPHIKLIVESVPEVLLDATGIVCSDNLPKTITVKNVDPLLTYNWEDANGLDLGSGISIEILKEGEYTVTAVDVSGCMSLPKTIVMSVSEKALLTLAAITVVDNGKSNSISIDVSVLGSGDYEFSLDEIDGDYQDSPYFGNVNPGIHILYVRDKNLCGISQIEISVLGFPKFFTPNNDGFNDYWNIKGLSKKMYAKATVVVFDRFGKMLKTFDDNAIGWDGSYNGYRVPSTDYWYVITLIDLKGEARVVRGNFSLIRRKNE